MFVDFLYLFVASLLLGMLFGLATAFILRAFHFGHTAQEVALIGMMAYLAYLMGDLLGLSGILALFVSAVAISHYALHNISAQSRTTTIYAFHTLSYISEGIIFVYCGLDALDPLKWRVRGRGGGGEAGGDEMVGRRQACAAAASATLAARGTAHAAPLPPSTCPTRMQNTNVRDLLWMFWILIILLLVSRALMVLPIALLHNRFSHHELSAREIATIWWGGLMRGAVSVALVYYFFDPHGISGDPHFSTVITTTLIVVLISILLFGAATKPLLDYLMGPDTGPGGGALREGGGGGGVGGEGWAAALGPRWAGATTNKPPAAAAAAGSAHDEHAHPSLELPGRSAPPPIKPPGAGAAGSGARPIYSDGARGCGGDVRAAANITNVPPTLAATACRPSLGRDAERPERAAGGGRSPPARSRGARVRGRRLYAAGVGSARWRHAPHHQRAAGGGGGGWRHAYRGR